MTPADFHAILRRRPFVPFRVVTTDSTVYEVRHPELVLVSLSSAVIGYPVPGDPNTAGRYDIVSIRHVIRFEPLEEQQPIPPTDGNGQNAP